MQASRTLRGSGIALSVLAAACSSAGGPSTSTDASSRGDGAATDGSAHATHDASPRDAKRRDAPPADAGADRSAQPVDAAADVAKDVAFVPAAHTLLQIPDNGGPVLAHPKLVTVTYADDPQRAFVEQLGAYLVTSPWLATVGAEYGVGLGTSANVELPGPAPAAIDDAEIQALVEALVRAGTAPDSDASVTARELPPETDGGIGDAGPDAWDGGGDGGPPVQMPEVVYMMFFPATTALTVGGSLICDVSGGGYHFQTSLASGGQAFAYGVITECPMSQTSDLVQSVSHELIEAATDPSQADLAYAITNLLDPWSYFGGEVGDLCSLLSPQWSEGGFSGIQRVYSDKAAAAGGDPCLPEPGPYYGTTVIPSTARLVAPGSSVTYDITGWSNAPVASWYLASELYISSPSTFQPTFTVDAMQLNNGGHATMTVAVPAGSPSGSYALGLVYSSMTEADYTTQLVEVYVQ